LPEGLDPCDLLVAQGADSFRQVLDGAVDALDFKLAQLLGQAGDSVEGTKRVVDSILGVMALAPELPGQAGQVKQELLITRVAQRLGLRQETVWARLGELKAARRRDAHRSPSAATASPRTPAEESAGQRARPARTIEKELLQILLAEPALVSQAYTTIRPEEVEHPGLQQLLAGMYTLWEQGEPPDLDGLRATIDNPALIDWAIDNQDIGRTAPDRGGWFRSVLDRFRTDRLGLQRQRLMDRLRAAATEDERQRLLRQIQDLSKGPDPQTGGPSP